VKFRNKRVLVLGVGSSGLAAKNFLEQRGAEVIVYDDNVQISEETSRSTRETCDLAVISPGISINHPLAKQMQKNNIPISGACVNVSGACASVISELELGFCEKHGKVVAVTGTNGKTTVSNMINDALGRKSVLCGNVGIPVTSVAKQLRRKTAVVEVSSFQLEASQSHGAARTLRGFRPNIAVILNITQDHLERHGTMEEYIRCKAAISKNQKKRDVLILNFDDANCRSLGTHQKVLWFSTTAKVKGIYLDGRDITLNIKRRAQKIFTLDELGAENQHDIQNILAVILTLKLLKVPKSAIKKACRAAKMPHRLQYIGNLKTRERTVMFFNDSKSTNVASTLAACRCFKSPVNLLLGGVSKGQSFAELFEKLPAVVQNIFAFGQAAAEIIKAANEAGFLAVVKCNNLEDATHRAIKAGTGPLVVLLSPACSSFDMFKNYEHRGEEFVKTVDMVSKSFDLGTFN